MSTDWAKQLRQAAEAYTDAVLRSDLGLPERRAAAVRFRAIAACSSSGAEAIEAASAMARSGEGVDRLVAARLLAAIPTVEASAALLEAFSDPRAYAPPPDALAYLGLDAPLPDAAWSYLAIAPADQRGSLITALLRQPSEAGTRLLEQLVADGDPLAGQAIAAAGWCERVLRRVAHGPRHAEPSMPPWLTVDLRVEAAFRLGLDGDSDAVTRLERWAAGFDDGDAGNALVRLAWLAWPPAVGLARAVLEGAEPALQGLALDASRALRAGALVAPLLELSVSPAAPSAPDGLPLARDAAAIAVAIAGDAVERAPGVAALDPTARYRRGRPLELTDLVAELASPHTAITRAAGYSLRSISGENHGFEPDLDLIATLPAIEEWERSAATATFLEPGGWAWQGQPLAPPSAL